MLFQARQDFIDIHKDILKGRSTTLERYDHIAKELKSLDDINFEWMLQFVQKTENIEIEQMWKDISSYIQAVKRSGTWQEKKDEIIRWEKDQLK